MNGINRAEIKPDLKIWIVLKQDKRSGKFTEGIVKDILTKFSTHPHGIKVLLESGQVGHIKKRAKSQVRFDICVFGIVQKG